MDAVNESTILKKLDPAVKDREDDWPQFILRDVIVASQKTGKLMSLLQAHKIGKARMIGTLYEKDTDAETRKRFKKRLSKQERIVVENVYIYSYGKYHDGSLAFWASGEAGWFELRTQAPEYKEIYTHMEEATEMLYFAVSRAQRLRKGWRDATPKQVKDIMRVTFEAWVTSDYNKQRKDHLDAADGFRTHRHFLIKCMLEGAESVDWANTPFFRWFDIHFPADVKLIEEVVNQTGSISLEDLHADGTHANGLANDMPAVTRAQRASEADAGPTGNGRRSRRLAEVAAPEDDSSEELTARRGSSRSKHKRKSQLRIPGSAKTPQKSAVRVNGLTTTFIPDMEYFREAKRMDEAGIEYMSEEEVEDTAKIAPPDVVRGLQHADLREISDETRAIQPHDAYWEPKGPDGTWVCPYDGCAHRVWDADTLSGKSLVKAHYAQAHQKSVEELILSESRPWAKTSMLMAKVRSFQQAKEVGLRPTIDEVPPGSTVRPIRKSGY